MPKSKAMTSVFEPRKETLNSAVALRVDFLFRMDAEGYGINAGRKLLTRQR
jgi:hypothetical protein